jgi:cytochrome oxidase Cu insertion factor (SCO1/SenC/PrrC family)
MITGDQVDQSIEETIEKMRNNEAFKGFFAYHKRNDDESRAVDANHVKDAVAVDKDGNVSGTDDHKESVAQVEVVDRDNVVSVGEINLSEYVY